MDKQQPKDLIKAFASGNFGALRSSMKQNLKPERLTAIECYLLWQIIRGNLPGADACIAYYMQESNKRPPTEAETRGYAKADDKPKEVPGSDKVVCNWYRKLNLPPDTKCCQPLTVK